MKETMDVYPATPVKHQLKTDPDVFDDVVSGRKTFEIRKNDRNFKIGDELVLRKTKFSGNDMANGFLLVYTGDYVVVTVSYILHGPIYGLQDGWVIMSIE